MLGNFIAPASIDRYLACTGFTGQTTGRRAAENRSDNLVQPVHELHRTRGSFGREAESRALTVPGPATRLASR